MKKDTKKEEIFDEIRKLAERAEQSSNQQMDLFINQKIGDEDIELGFDSSILKDTANPDKSHKLYYGARRMLMDYLPKDKELRKKVYEEKNLFLNRGIGLNKFGYRGSDGRMTYIVPFLEVVFNTVAKWVASGANAYDIWQAFWDLNEERGYHKPEVELTEFNQNLKKMLDKPKEDE